jgi:hypothetical protein
MQFDLFFDVLSVALAGRRLDPSHGAAARHIVFSITDSADALTITMTPKDVRLERGRVAPSDAEVALVRGSLGALTSYLLVGDKNALGGLAIYGRMESLIELGEVLRAQKSMLALRVEQAPPSKKRGRGAR